MKLLYKIVIFNIISYKPRSYANRNRTLETCIYFFKSFYVIEFVTHDEKTWKFNVISLVYFTEDAEKISDNLKSGV